ncbi:hypothetical protein SS05631_c40910 [Sinorhizobium sp. CCBAU 05631]|uniref:Uncharacterized protein n=1 Tax=Rhizobium fredii TaxID=380 RepID=A0A2L0H098_RHIFR|nr:hypothetical protein SS05631_c40910 [Sinorhizobium sp. CCBAU 05631]AUX74906.1 hypothetical protein NXT3_CH00296 [Sinorhizobium fredii]
MVQVAYIGVALKQPPHRLILSEHSWCCRFEDVNISAMHLKRRMALQTPQNLCWAKLED